MELPFRPKPGEEKFIRRFEKEHLPGEERKEALSITPEEAKEKIKISLERIRKEIEEDIEREKSFHPHLSTSSISDITNILAQAVQIALNEGVEEAIRFILATGNPHLIDAFHDILIEHFFETLVNIGKIKLVK